MRIKRILLFAITLLSAVCTTSFSQSLDINFNTLAGSKGQLPFWLWANQLGRYDQYSENIQHLGFFGNYQHHIRNSNISFKATTDIDVLITNENEIRITQLYGEINWRFLCLQVGTFPDKEVYGGLSTTNGNMSASLNARPYPRIRVGFNRYAYITKWLGIYGFYEEGILNDNRDVDNTQLHRKAIYVRLGETQYIQLTGGIEHFVMWNGISPKYGKLQGWDTYFDYILGHRGNKNSLMTDQLNVVGNSYGSYQIKIAKSWRSLDATSYLSHPFDDHSGMVLQNYRDNLIGLFININREYPILKNIVAEYFYTKHQSGRYHLTEAPEWYKHKGGRDDYYNHGVYSSGATYHQMAICSPLFGPVNIEDGISMGFDNTRFAGFHIAAKGFINKSNQWKAIFTYSENYGVYTPEGITTYQPSRSMIATYLQLKHKIEKLPLSITLSTAIDHGSLYDDGENTTRIGGMLSILYQPFKEFVTP